MAKPKASALGARLTAFSVPDQNNRPRISRISISEITPNPHQPRLHFDDEKLQELSASIQANGLLQPILVNRNAESGSFTLVAGERRWRASQLAGLTEIDAIISTGDPREVALVENIQRENLTAVEEANSVAELVASKGYTHEEVGAIIGVSRVAITRLIGIAGLPEDIKQVALASGVSKAFLIELAELPEDAMRSTWTTCVATGDFRRDTIRQSKARSPGKGSANPVQDAFWKRVVKPFRDAKFMALPRAEKEKAIERLQQLTAELLAQLEEGR